MQGSGSRARASNIRCLLAFFSPHTGDTPGLVPFCPSFHVLVAGRKANGTVRAYAADDRGGRGAPHRQGARRPAWGLAPVPLGARGPLYGQGGSSTQPPPPQGDGCMREGSICAYVARFLSNALCDEPKNYGKASPFSLCRLLISQVQARDALRDTWSRHQAGGP